MINIIRLTVTGQYDSLCFVCFMNICYVVIIGDPFPTRKVWRRAICGVIIMSDRTLKYHLEV